MGSIWLFIYCRTFSLPVFLSQNTKQKTYLDILLRTSTHFQSETVSNRQLNICFWHICQCSSPQHHTQSCFREILVHYIELHSFPGSFDLTIIATIYIPPGLFPPEGRWACTMWPCKQIYVHTTWVKHSQTHSDRRAVWIVSREGQTEKTEGILSELRFFVGIAKDNMVPSFIRRQLKSTHEICPLPATQNVFDVKLHIPHTYYTMSLFTLKFSEIKTQRYKN